MASIEPEFDKRGVKIIGLSVDPVENHERLVEGHRGDAGHRANYPLIGDTDFSVSKAYGMLSDEVEGDATSARRRRTRRCATSS